MINDVSYWTRVLRRILYVVLILFGLLITMKLSVFYMPFLIAFIISLIIEPGIKYLMKKINLTRKISSIIIFIIVTTIIIGLLIWGTVSLISEASNMLEGLNSYVEKIGYFINEINNRFNKISLPKEITDIVNTSSKEIINNVSNWIRSFLNGLLNVITSIPKIAICIFITILALYFICVDKIYILDQVEHHIPKKWVSKMGNHLREIIITLGGFIKAEAILIIISFFISLIGLYVLKIFKFNIQYPLLMALFIGFVDLLPILGSGTVMIPWAIINSLNGDLKLGIAILILFIIMSVIRQLLEPRLVSKHIGTHPIFTLIAMYTGFKFLGIIGLLVGPILLIIIKNIFSSLIDEGILKSLFSKE